MRRHWVSNPRGLGGLACRPHDRFAIGARGTPQCGAKTRRTGKPCRAAPVSGSKRCYYHGGMSTGRGKPVLWTNRQAHSKAMALTRKAAQAELERTTLHSETRRNFAPYVGSLYAPSIPQALLACDDWTRGLISRSQFKAVLELARQHVGPHNPNPKRWKRKAPLVSASRSIALAAAPARSPAPPSSEPHSEFVELRPKPDFEVRRSAKPRDTGGW
jgi:hypothetical protein